MFSRYLPFVVSLILLSQVQYAGADKWSDALLSIKRLDPFEFTAQRVPSEILNQLKKRGCTIPQAVNAEDFYYHTSHKDDPLLKPHNIISGEFAKKGQRDWVAVCSKSGTTSLMIFGGGESACPTEISADNDTPWLTGINEIAVYARVIGSADSSKMKHLSVAEGNKPPSFSHDGISETDLDKQYFVHYCHKGKWIKLYSTYE